MTDDPTPGELSRQLDAMDRQLGAIREQVARLPTADLLAAQQGRVDDRISRVERDVASALTAVERVARALESERDARVAAVQAEGLARETQIQAEKDRVTGSIRWLFSGLVASFGAWAAKAIGWG